MTNLTILAHGDYSGLIFLAVLMLLAVAVGCLILIVASFRLTSKLGGSRSLIWGALLGVATVYIFPVSVLWGNGLQFLNWNIWFERILPEATQAVALACLVNLFIWYRKHPSKQA